MSASDKFDVAVIGSGPSGTIAAQRLSSRGLKVILFEKAGLPRYKTCGGGIVKRITDYLPAGIFSVFEKEYNHVLIVDEPAGFNYKLERNYPVVYMTMRERFDSILLDHAVSSGITLKSNCKVFDIIPENDCIVLDTASGIFKALFVLGADGAQGITLKKSGLNISRKNLPAIEYEIYVSDKDLEDNNSVIFDFGSVPGGYAWVFPKEDHLSVGAGIFSLKSKTKNLPSYLHGYINKLNFREIIKTERHGYYIPVSLADNRISSDRIMLLGDAAALADPLTAEGISSAVLSGKLASDAIIEENLDPRKTSLSYNNKIEKQLYNNLRASRLLSRVFYQYPALRIFLVKKYGVRLSEIIADIITGKRNYNELLKNPLNYIKLLKYYFKSGTIINQTNSG